MSIFAHTADLLPDHIAGLLATRNPGPDSSGSVFNVPQTVESLDSADWQTFDHPAVQAPATAFRASIPGKVGIVRLDTLSADTAVKLTDGHETGFVSATVLGEAATPVDFSVMLVGPADDGSDIVWTVHPGEPVRPSSIPAAGHEGETITVAEALAMGFEFGKVGG